MVELLHIPPWYLHYQVVEGGLEAGCGDFCDAVLHFGQGEAEAEFGCYVGEWVAGGFGGECGGAGEAGVDFDDVVAGRVRIEGVLNVTL